MKKDFKTALKMDEFFTFDCRHFVTFRVSEQLTLNFKPLPFIQDMRYKDVLCTAISLQCVDRLCQPAS